MLYDARRLQPLAMAAVESARASASSSTSVQVGGSPPTPSRSPLAYDPEPSADTEDENLEACAAFWTISDIWHSALAGGRSADQKLAINR